jgi:hypothetical protein
VVVPDFFEEGLHFKELHNGNADAADDPPMAADKPNENFRGLARTFANSERRSNASNAATDTLFALSAAIGGSSAVSAFQWVSQA